MVSVNFRRFQSHYSYEGWMGCSQDTLTMLGNIKYNVKKTVDELKVLYFCENTEMHTVI